MFDSVLKFVSSIVAGVIAHYICKWLDRQLGSQSAQKKIPGCTRGSFFVRCMQLYVLASTRFLFRSCLLYIFLLLMSTINYLFCKKSKLALNVIVKHRHTSLQYFTITHLSYATFQKELQKGRQLLSFPQRQKSTQRRKPLGCLIFYWSY